MTNAERVEGLTKAHGERIQACTDRHDTIVALGEATCALAAELRALAASLDAAERERNEAKMHLKRIAPTGKLNGHDIYGWERLARERGEALRELVAVSNLLRAIEEGEYEESDGTEAIVQYNRRAPLAWDAARRLEGKA